VAAVAIEVADVLKENGYKVNVEDYDFRPGASFVEAMHEGIKNSRDLLILYTADYEASLYTRKEFTSFVAEMAQSTEERHIIILRCEDVPLRGLLSDIPFQDLVGVHDTQERKRRIKSPPPSVNRKQRHRHPGRSSECHRVSRASQAARTNLIGSMPSSCATSPLP
jgi:TIR domain